MTWFWPRAGTKHSQFDDRDYSTEVIYRCFDQDTGDDEDTTGSGQARTGARGHQRGEGKNSVSTKNMLISNSVTEGSISAKLELVIVGTVEKLTKRVWWVLFGFCRLINKAINSSQFGKREKVLSIWFEV